MNQLKATAKRIDTTLVKLVAILILLLAVFLLFWAGVIVVIQCVGWLKSGSWQGVSIGLLFVTEDTHRVLRLFDTEPNAISFVPAWGSALSTEGVAAKMALKKAGLQMICSWLLTTPFVVWLVCFGCVLMRVSALMENKTILVHGD